MSAESPSKTSRREMRKALVCLRMEMHRQEIRREASQLVNPMTRLRGMGKGVTQGMGIKHAPLWGIAGVTLLGFLTGKRARSTPTVVAEPHRKGGMGRAIKLTTTLMPLIRLALRLNSNRQ
ncbi:hypothetical protein SFA35_18015 [Pseudomonas sp. HR96]|uniref:hypothetical protein n=1 Tax=Pseudomonas sp. HR96 TaxID=1027966 RepID=UPI002A75D9BC|nr:hypothetical protein [Pseudomonas sp. HR96]WPO98516.1 hypothetical protein SFA35_18015 [Pseudomonas sp. HR96]